MWSADTLEWIDVELTSYCNIECAGCYRTNSKFTENFLNTGKIDPDMLKKKITLEKFPNLKFINFCGNIDEPVSHPKIYEICEWALGLGIEYVNISSNGSLRKPEWWYKFGQLFNGNGGGIFFALDGTDPETHARYRVGSDFNRVIENARAFMAGNGRAIWQFIVFDYNEHQIPEVERLAKEYGFESVKFIYSARPENEKTKGYKRKKVEEYEEVECKYGVQKRVQINYLGNVIPCCHVNPLDIEYNTASDKQEYEKHLDNKVNAYGKKYGLDYVQNYVDAGSALCNNIEYNDIEDVIEGDWFKSIEDSWATDNPISVCKARCKKRNLDYFEKKFIQ